MTEVWAVIRVDEPEEGYAGEPCPCCQTVVCVYPDEETAEQHADLANRELTAWNGTWPSGEGDVVSAGAWASGEYDAIFERLKVYDPGLQIEWRVDHYDTEKMPFRLHVDQFLEMNGR